MHHYQKAGKYIAICNKTNFNGHYTLVFDYPQAFIDDYQKSIEGLPDRKVPDAGWYFLNRVNFTACLEAIYPVEIFSGILEAVQ